MIARTLFFLTLGFFLCPNVSVAKDRPPNIIVIMADDLGIGDLSTYRKGAPRTPNIDRLAMEGMKFTDAHSPSSVCTPTRYSLLTGRYAWRSWLQDWVLSERMPLLVEEGTPTLPGMMQEAGYRTACIGKWHLGFGREMDAWQNNDFSIGPNAVGFDYFFGVPFSHNSSPEMEVFMVNDRIVGLPEGHSLWDPVGLTAARRSLENTAGDLSSAAVHFIRENQFRPFFMYYAATNVHFPITPHAAFRMRQRGNDHEGLYDGFVAEFDWAVGEVLRTLDRLSLTKNTMVIVTSDNGASLSFGGSNEPWSGNKGEILEGGHRIPLLLRWPSKVEAGSESTEPVVLTDLYTTVADILGVEEELPEDSVSWLPLLQGEDLDRGPIVHHSISGMFAIRDGDWKFVDGVGTGRSRFQISLKDDDAVVHRRKNGSYEPFSFQPIPVEAKEGEPPGQLYHLGNDPGETENLFRQYPEIVQDLKQKLDTIRSQEE